MSQREGMSKTRPVEEVKRRHLRKTKGKSYGGRHKRGEKTKRRRKRETETETEMKKEIMRRAHLFLEEAAQLIHHGITTVGAAVGRAVVVGAVTAAVVGRVTALALVLVLLDRVFGDASHDRTTDCPEEAMVGLVTCEPTGSATGKGASETALTLLGSTGSLLTVSVKWVSVSGMFSLTGGMDDDVAGDILRVAVL